MINNSFIITASLLLCSYFLLEAVQHYCRADGDSLNCQIIEIPAYLVEPSLLLLWSLLSGFIIAGKAPFFFPKNVCTQDTVYTVVGASPGV